MAASAMSLSAQSSARQADAPAAARQGFFVGGGFGMGSAGLSCDGCDFGRDNGLSGYFRIGGTINPHVRLGFESNAWVKSEDGVDAVLGFWSGVGYYYPSLTNNLWFKGGLGLATAKMSDPSDELTTNGFGMSVGIGYDWAVSRGSFVLVPYAGYLHQMGGKLKFNGSSTGVSMNSSLFQFGIGLGFRH
jgi:hypothetical protein